MDMNSVPQEDSVTYANNKKAIYARGEDGNISVVGSSGWNAEETATTQALEDLQESMNEAHKEVMSGSKSPLYYHMFAVRMDLQVLSETTGFFKWTIKKDFVPSKFAKISEKRLAVYSDVMGIEPQDLKIIKERDNESN